MARRKVEETPENEERWLLTYADMLTLMFALFMVLFSISSVNISKYKTLQQSLKSAFSGSVLTGGKSIISSGSEASSTQHSVSSADIPSIVAITPNIPRPQDTSAKQISSAMLAASGTLEEQSSFKHLEQQIDKYAQTHGISKQLEAIITRQGLIIRVLTDNLLFSSGSATLQSTGDPVLDDVAGVLKTEVTRNPIVVEGNTDDVPIHTAQFPSNWNLSTDRAVSVLNYMVAHGVPEQRLGAAGYSDTHPVDSNATAAGRAKNRRVDILVQRLYPAPSTP